jgi:O-antigen/teichoic acid export membrane protein/GT2 family glycosyltransferase
MNGSSSHASRHAVDGTLWGFLAEAMLLPTGLITAGFLTRRLGMDEYGLFSVAAALVAWIEWSIISLLARPSIKLLGEAGDWRPVAATVLRVHLAAGLGVGLLLWLLAPPIAGLMGEPALTGYLRVFALDIPVFTLASAHRCTLIGAGYYRHRALATAGRWTARLLLVLLLVSLGLSVWGAILASVGASLAELVISRFSVRPSLFHASVLPVRRLLGCAAPLFMCTLCMRLYACMDLFTLKALGATAAVAGIYSAASNLSLVPNLFGTVFSPILLSTLSRVQRTEGPARARQIGGQALRGAVALLPLGGLTAGAAPEIVDLVFGSRFAPAAPLLAWLIFGALAVVLFSVATTILLAADRPQWTFALAAPLMLLAAGAYLVVIPRLGAPGAAAVTSLVAALGALSATAAVYRAWKVLPPAGTVARSALITGLVYAGALCWPAPGPWLLLKLPLLGMGSLLLFWLLGEFSAGEIALARSLLPIRSSEFRVPSSELKAANPGTPNPELQTPNSEPRTWNPELGTRNSKPGTRNSELGTRNSGHLPYFSIVIATCNRPRQLGDCLRSLAELEYPRERFEVIVVDDGGSEPLTGVLEPWRRELDLTLLTQPNGGPGAARNTGAARARGPFLAFTDDDCCPDPGWLNALAEGVTRRPDALLGGQVVNGLPGNPCSAASQLLQTYLYGYYNADPDEASFFTSNNMAVRLEDFRAAGEFDASLRVASEDREFCHRWRIQGRPLLYVPAAMVHHAHALTLRSFWRQHYNYGRGGCHYHHIRARHAGGRIRLEPPSFYLSLLGYPFRREKGGRALLLAALLAISQAANASGFFMEQTSTRRAVRKR